MDTVLPKSNKPDAQSQELNIKNPNTDGRFAAPGDVTVASSNGLPVVDVTTVAAATATTTAATCSAVGVTVYSSSSSSSSSSIIHHPSSIIHHHHHHHHQVVIEGDIGGAYRPNVYRKKNRINRIVSKY